MTSEKQAGFSLLEVIVSTAILFSVAGAFLSMTAANGVLLTREHSLMQNVYELSELAEEGQGEWTGEELEIIFEGEEEDASEIFEKYIVTSEGGDSIYIAGTCSCSFTQCGHRDLGSRLFRQSDA